MSIVRLALLSAMFSDLAFNEKKEVLPAGCERFYFCYDEIVSSQYAEIADFSCIAISKKSAIEKYKKWKNKLA